MWMKWAIPSYKQSTKKKKSGETTDTQQLRLNFGFASASRNCSFSNKEQTVNFVLPIVHGHFQFMSQLIRRTGRRFMRLFGLFPNQTKVIIKEATSKPLSLQ